MVEPASSAQYKDANKLANVVLPGEPQYAAAMRGESVPPEPVNAKPRKAEARRHGAGLGDAGDGRASRPGALGGVTRGRAHARPRRRPAAAPRRAAPRLAQRLSCA